MTFELIRGVALLLALSLFQGLLSRTWREDRLAGQVASGLLFGAVTVVGLAYPLVLGEGVIFDARSVVLSMAAFFYGPVTGVVAGLVAGAYRTWLGGVGLLPGGLGSICAYVLLGLAYRWLQKRFGWPHHVLGYLLFGFIVQLSAAGWFLTLPPEIASNALRNVTPLAILIFTPATALLGMLLRDVRRNVETAEALRVSEERFRKLYNESPIPMLALDREGLVRDVNDVWLIKLDYQREDVVGIPLSGLLTSESAKRWEERLLPALAKGDSCLEEPLRLKSGEGEVRDFLLTANAERNSAGQVIGSHAVLADVTERRKAEAALQGSEARYERIFNHSQAAILEQDFSQVMAVLDRLHAEGVEDLESHLQEHPDLLGRLVEELRVLEVNRTAVQLFEAESKEDLIARYGETLSEDAAEFFLPEVVALWNREEFFRAERELVTLKGRVLKTIITLPLPRDANEARDVPVIIVDITAQKQAENALQRSQKLESIGQLTGGVAHDFNNLLAIMIGNIEQLEPEMDGSERAHAILSRLKRAVDRGAGLTQRLLAFSRQQPLSPQPTDVKAQAHGLADMLTRTLGETVELTISTDDALWPAMVDPHQLEHALVNLALNARDAMPDGGRLTVELRNITLDEDYAARYEEVQAGDYVLLAVSDTGTGMTPEILSEAFTPFFTTKEVGQGSGLGLSMVYGFAKQSNGHVALYSEPGQGTVVRLYLPRADGQGEIADAAQADDEAPGGKERILVVEDDHDVRTICVTGLEAAGYAVTEASNGEEAIAALKGGERFDLLFTDVVLPGGMNGVDIAREAVVLQAGIKVLYSTGYSEQAVIHDGRLAPGVALIGKPYRRQALLAAVRNVLEGRPL